MAPIITVEDIPDQISFQFSGQEPLTLDLIEAELHIEKFAVGADPDNPTEPILTKIQEWFRDDHARDITPSQAWRVFLTVRTAYESYKKKLNGTLQSLITTSSTPGNSNQPN